MIDLKRRRLLTVGASALGASLVATRSDGKDNSSAGACAEITPTPGWDSIPEYKWDAPERASLLEPGISGERIAVTGRILNTCGTPLSGARLEYWHADPSGKYDYEGYRFRGYQTIGADGRYRIDTIKPGVYHGNYSHIHYFVAGHAAGKDRSSQSLLKSFIIAFPTQDEFEKASPSELSYLVPASKMIDQSGVSVAHYDIVFQLS